MGKNFDELLENYAAENTLDFINAMVQEISAQGHLLYEIDVDSDSYLLTIIPAEAEEELKSILKEQRKRGILRKQARRKARIYNIYETKAGTIHQNSTLESG